jgi:citrate synthase
MVGTEVYSPGLEGVIAGETAISTVTGGLRYRGYPVTELAEAASFDEVAYMLLHGELPTKAELKAFHQRLAQASTLPKVLVPIFRQLPPAANTMDVLRTAVSILAHFDPDVGDSSDAANLRKAERLLAQIPVAVAQHYRVSGGLEPIAPRLTTSLAANLLYMIRGKEPSPAAARALDVSLILYAEHEFNALPSPLASSSRQSPTCIRASWPQSAP